MKNSNLLAFILGMITIGGISVFALSNTNHYRNSDGTPNFQALKSTANNNKLNAEMRDALMDGLSRLQQQQGNNQSNSIPAGAIMAFNLSACPAGWTRFTDADGRFIMGNSTNSREKGGSGSIMMKREQLAPHSHWFVDTIFSESIDATTTNRGIIGDTLYQAVIEHSKQSRPAKGWIGTNTSHDPDNNLITVKRKTGQSITRGSDTVYTGNNGTRKTSPWATPQNPFTEETSPTPQQPIDITNPYIKLLYCQKN